MDYNILTQMLIDSAQRNYWIKPVNLQEQGTDPTPRFTESRVRIDFENSPVEMQVGDIVIVYQAKISRIMYVAQCETSVMRATFQEVIEEPWRDRWPYYVNGINLTPTYGGQWTNLDLKMFNMVKAFNQNYPDQRIRVSTSKLNAEKAKISEEFAHYVMRKIRLL
jgi:hypothetical protein